jgi:hypothetical protein
MNFKHKSFSLNPSKMIRFNTENSASESITRAGVYAYEF